MNNSPMLSNKLMIKLGLTFLFLIILMGVSYILITLHFTEKHFQETAQKLNTSLAQDLIDEKFQEESPFLADGSVNKELFGDLMHDMMAVNRSIEVYLLSSKGEILYSVVLDHSDPNKKAEQVSLEPIHAFIESNGNKLILGDDPRNIDEPNIFSAAAFELDGKSGYIYIILSGQELATVNSSLFGSYFLKLGVGSAAITTLFTLLVGLISIWFLTKNLREIIQTVNRFQKGDMAVRIENPNSSDLAILATNFNEMADTISEQIKEIKSVDNLRRELIANVSHDLRTPLAILKGYVETLQMKSDQLDETEKNKYLDIIHFSSDRLSKLITQLFEYSKLEAKQIQPQNEPFSMTDLAMDIVANYQILGNKKQIEVGLKTEDKVPLVFADISLVERAIQNLMDNALKFTPTGGSVVLKVSSLDKNVKVTVSDTGSGIAENEQVQLFERYRQSKETKKGEGIGLGLAIVKKIMELHNTTIQIISKPNEGSSFYFSLPMYSA